MAKSLMTAKVYGLTDPSYNNPKTHMAHFKAIVKKGTHKTQPYTVTVDKRVDTKVKQRYKTQYSAERGALRQFRPQGEGLPKYKYSAVLIELPGGRRRMGFIYPSGTMHFNPIVTPKKK